MASLPDPCPKAGVAIVPRKVEMGYHSAVPALSSTGSPDDAMPRSSNPYELSFRSRLGKAAQIGGLWRVEQEAARALPIALAAGLDSDTVSRMLRTFRMIADRCERAPPRHEAPSPDRRVKVRWTPERIAQFKVTAPWCKDNKALASKLGLPEFCEGSMRAARSRYRVATTRRPGRKPQICAPASVLREAA